MGKLAIRGCAQSGQETRPGKLNQAGIYTNCIDLDPDDDEYVQDIFGNLCSVIDKIEGLP